MLAYLYRELCRASLDSVTEISNLSHYYMYFDITIYCNKLTHIIVVSCLILIILSDFVVVVMGETSCGST